LLGHAEEEEKKTRKMEILTRDTDRMEKKTRQELDVKYNPWHG
jgi:hypothetical protein